MSEDLIRRSDAIKAFVEETNGVNVEKAIREVDAYLKIRECDEVWDSIRAIRDCLECAKDEIAEYIPSADRPQGEWVPFEYGDERWHKCTACGVADRYIEYVERPNGTTGKLVAIRNYCPNCGARMKGADDEMQ